MPIGLLVQILTSNSDFSKTRRWWMWLLQISQQDSLHNITTRDISPPHTSTWDPLSITTKNHYNTFIATCTSTQGEAFKANSIATPTLAFGYIIKFNVMIHATINLCTVICCCCAFICALLSLFHISKCH